MSYIDVPCQESVSLIKGSKCPLYIQDKLYLGYNFETYLFFGLPPAAFFGRVKQARLILFKIPPGVIEASSIPKSNRYVLWPLLDFFSLYSNWYRPPETDGSLRLDYEDRADMSYTEIDITEIAKAWIRQNPENKGLLLAGVPNARSLTYASDQYKTPGMRPMLRLTYEGVSQPTSVAPCTVEIK
jgi:hypothetical protein